MRTNYDCFSVFCIRYPVSLLRGNLLNVTLLNFTKFQSVNPCSGKFSRNKSKFSAVPSIVLLGLE